MPRKKIKRDYASHRTEDQAPQCEAVGCAAAGMYKAPTRKNAPDEYRWLCLNHIREYNKKWDFFAGMSRAEIEHFMRDAVTGHRPTWRREQQKMPPTEHLEEALYAFMHGNKKPHKLAPTISQKLRQALALMDMDYPYSLGELKIRYRKMVKQFHPDAHKGSRKHEEKFKEITASFRLLSEHLKTQK